MMMMMMKVVVVVMVVVLGHLFSVVVSDDKFSFAFIPQNLIHVKIKKKTKIR